MKNFILPITILTGFLLVSVLAHSQNPVNWTEKQLMAPSELAGAITMKKEMPVVISVGPGATIPGSVHVGMVNTKEGLEKLKMQLKGIEKDKKIVIYCGCCPFEHCPNIRPAIHAAEEIGFTHYYLLNLPQNIKKDWIDKGYPVAKP